MEFLKLITQCRQNGQTSQYLCRRYCCLHSNNVRLITLVVYSTSTCKYGISWMQYTFSASIKIWGSYDCWSTTHLRSIGFLCHFNYFTWAGRLHCHVRWRSYHYQDGYMEDKPWPLVSVTPPNEVSYQCTMQNFMLCKCVQYTVISVSAMMAMHCPENRSLKPSVLTGFW